jgi:hypothetical protein
MNCLEKAGMLKMDFLGLTTLTVIHDALTSIESRTGKRLDLDGELDSADQVMVDRYGNAVMLARRYNVLNPAVAKAIQRLAFFTDVVGEAKLSQYTGRVPSLEYTPGLFLRLRPGLVTAPRPEGMAPPAPPPVP